MTDVTPTFCQKCRLPHWLNEPCLAERLCLNCGTRHRLTLSRAVCANRRKERLAGRMYSDGKPIVVNEEPETEEAHGPKLTAPRLDAEGFVYFVSALGSGRVKIGWARNVQKRMADLATGCPFPLRLLAAAPAKLLEEGKIHAKFAKARKHLEWFDETDPDLADFIAGCMRRGLLPKEIEPYEEPRRRDRRPYQREVMKRRYWQRKGVPAPLLSDG